MTSGTDQGVEILKQAANSNSCNNDLINSTVAYFPFDKPAIMDQVVSTIRPKVMVLLETELWPGLLIALKKYGCKTIIINGRMTSKSYSRYRLLSSFWQKVSPEKILAISSDDAERFEKVFNPRSISVMPNIKFDQVDSSAKIGTPESALIQILDKNIPFVVLGSVRQEEESDVINIIRKVRQKAPEALIGLFPRHMHRIESWKNTLDDQKIPWDLRSNIKQKITYPGVIIWDTIGELSQAYGLSQAAFVGGTLAPLGGQNFLEALSNGVIPVIGPSWEDFVWVGEEVIHRGLLKVVKDWKEVAHVLIEDIKNPPSNDKIRGLAFEYIKEHQGGTNEACKLIIESVYGG